MRNRKNRGNGNLTCRIHTRITAEKYRELSELLTKCRSIHSHSELLRHILDNKAIVIKKRDASLDGVMEQLAGIRKELLSIGININQVTHRFHIEDQPAGKMLEAMEITQLYQQTDLKVSELFSVLAKLSSLWSQG
ncbi:mobilization protein [Pedobacter sp.]